MSRTHGLTAALLLIPFAAHAAPPGTETVLYSFGANSGSMTAPSGNYSDAGLLSAQNGTVFFGTASQGGILADGANGSGTLFEITSAQGSPGAAFTVLHTFDGTDGGFPTDVPVTDGTALYGVAEQGGPDDFGTVFRWVPNGKPGGLLQVLHAFTGGADGGAPIGGLYRAANGTLYGTTSRKGAKLYGTVFALAPPPGGHGAWTFSIIHQFTGTDGSSAQAALVADEAGNLYGTTAYGGPNSVGTVYELQPPPGGVGPWTETTIADFPGPGAPSQSVAPLIFDAAGNLYGTSAAGGTDTRGTVFELTPPAVGATAWTTTVLVSFSGLKGIAPQAPVFLAASGALEGTTQLGGAHGSGVAFTLTPPPAGQTAWTESLLLSFQNANAPKGAYPLAGFALAANGQLISTTPMSDTAHGGVIYLLQP